MLRGLPLALIAAGCARGGETFTPVPDGGDTADTGPVGGNPCVKNDDCKAPNLCQGNNGLECKGGYCVPTGKPMNCDDGVACTQDVCDANKNACAHTPNDSVCPPQSYCDPTQNCVQSLPCMPGDSVCDRLNVNACDGTWACDAQKKLCVKGSKPCPDRPNATTNCMGGQNPTCSWTCNMNWVDANGDLMLPANQVSNGCECNQTSMNDKPDLQFTDTNCDGIDGMVSGAIFVDGATGNDGNAGTMQSPKKTIGGGIDAAKLANPKKDVYVSKGTYVEAVVMADGVSIYGGYDAANKWSRANANVTTIASPNMIAISAKNLPTASEIQLFTISSQNAMGTSNGDGNSSYGVMVANATGGLVIRGCSIVAGNGASAINVGAGSTGSGGSKGGDASGTTLGGQGGSPCGALGGAGAPAVSGATGGNTGGTGTQVNGGGAGALGGPGGGAGTCSGSSSSNGSPASPVASNGSPGGPGQNGNAGGVIGALDAQATYLPATGGAGVSVGTPGGGGGGGGSGGGSAHGTPGSLCLNCSSIASGAGGGGGGGGCGGNPGPGGRGGGGSFAVALYGSTVTIDQTKMTTGAGGNGGNGGDGGDGGGGGGGGVGGQGATDSNACSTRSGGNGAAGSQGGQGGKGGAGAGGSGGPSVCVLYKGGSPTTMGTTCTNGGGGTGGNGGTNGQQTAPGGPSGTTGDLKAAL